MVRSCSRSRSDRVDLSSPVSASTRYAAKPPASAPEEHVGERHVAPVEVGQVQPHQQHHHRVDERRQVVGGEAVREEAAVGQRELQVLGEQRRRQLLAVLVDAAGHHALRDDGGQPHPLEVAQQPVLPERDRLLGLLDGVGVAAEPDDPHHVARQAAGERHDVLGPLLQRRRPRQPQQCRVRPVRDDAECHVPQARASRPRTTARRSPGSVTTPSVSTRSPGPVPSSSDPSAKPSGPASRAIAGPAVRRAATRTEPAGCSRR